LRGRKEIEEELHHVPYNETGLELIMIELLLDIRHLKYLELYGKTRAEEGDI
jgi:hypothetical protein